MNGFNIHKKAALDLVSLGALVHRLDPGIIPFRKAMECKIHVSGGGNLMLLRIYRIVLE